MNTVWPFVLVTALAIVAMIVGEWRGPRALTWIAKPVASTTFVALAISRGPMGTGYGRAVLAALVLSWLGDMLLIPRGAKRAFLAGLASFLLGHLMFAVAFVIRGVEVGWTLAALVPLLGGGALVLRWLMPHVQGAMRGPVLAYVAVITAMVALAAGVAGRGGYVQLAAAVAFFVSDLSVARGRFVAPGVDNLLWGLPLYFGAQLLFAATI